MCGFFICCVWADVCWRGWTVFTTVAIQTVVYCSVFLSFPPLWTDLTDLNYLFPDSGSQLQSFKSMNSRIYRSHDLSYISMWKFGKHVIVNSVLSLVYVLEKKIDWKNIVIEKNQIWILEKQYHIHKGLNNFYHCCQDNVSMSFPPHLSFFPTVHILLCFFR